MTVVRRSNRTSLAYRRWSPHVRICCGSGPAFSISAIATHRRAHQASAEIHSRGLRSSQWLAHHAGGQSHCDDRRPGAQPRRLARRADRRRLALRLSAAWHRCLRRQDSKADTTHRTEDHLAGNDLVTGRTYPLCFGRQRHRGKENLANAAPIYEFPYKDGRLSEQPTGSLLETIDPSKCGGRGLRICHRDSGSMPPIAAPGSAPAMSWCSTSRHAPSSPASRWK